jgi:hypothetical protein
VTLVWSQWKICFLSYCATCFTLFIVVDLCDFFSLLCVHEVLFLVFVHGLDAGLLLRVGVKDRFFSSLPKDWFAQRRGTRRRRHSSAEQGRILGKTTPTGGSQLAVTMAQEMVTDQLVSGIGPGDIAALGRHGENGPRPFFPI